MIKVGISKCIDKRLKQLQTGNSHELRLIASLDCRSKMHALYIESNIHQLINKHRLHGEWFTVSSIERIHTQSGCQFDWVFKPWGIAPEQMPSDITWAIKKYKKAFKVTKIKGKKARARAECFKSNVLHHFKTNQSKKTLFRLLGYKIQPVEPTSIASQGNAVEFSWTSESGIIGLIFMPDGTLLMHSEPTYSKQLPAHPVTAVDALVSVNAFHTIRLKGSKLSRCQARNQARYMKAA